MMNSVVDFKAQELEGEAPHFTEPLQPAIVQPGEPARLSCTVVAKPVPTITWYKEEEQIFPGPDYQVSYDQATGKTELIVLNVVSQDCVYKCEAVNQFGKAVSRANLLLGQSLML